MRKLVECLRYRWPPADPWMPAFLLLRYRQRAGGCRRLPAILLKSDPTVREVHHELVHYLHWRKIRSNAYSNLPRTLEYNMPEQVVFDFFENSPKRWNALTPEEQQHMIEYIERIGGFR